MCVQAVESFYILLYLFFFCVFFTARTIQMSQVFSMFPRLFSGTSSVAGVAIRIIAPQQSPKIALVTATNKLPRESLFQHSG